MTLLWAIGVALLVVWPNSNDWEGVLGNPLGETGNHLWMMWRAVLRLTGEGGTVANAPVGVSIPLMDPVNLPWFALGSLWSPAAGFRVMALANVGIAMAGAYALARQLTDRQAARVAMVAAGAAPFLSGVIDFGITESWPIGWFGVHLAALLWHARGGPWWAAVAAGGALGCVALSGWYHALFGLFVEAMVVPVLFARYRRWGTWLQGGVALGMVVPALVRFLAVADQWAPRARAPAPGPPGPREDWATLPVFGTDLLTFVCPQPSLVSDPSKSVYIGVLVLLLVVVALVRRPRVAAPLVALSLPFLVLALGYWPTMAGRAFGFPGPAKVLVEAIPKLQGMSHWYRATGPAVLFLAVAAGVALDGVRVRFVHHIVMMLVVVDGLALSVTAWPRRVVAVSAPESLLALPGTGGIVQVPFDNGRREFSDDPPRLYQLWQVAHGRQIAENYEGVDALLASSRLVAAVDDACLLPTTLPPYYQPPPAMRELGPPPAEEVAAETQALADAGFDWIVVHRERCPVTVTPMRMLADLLGPPVELPGGDRAWPLHDGVRRHAVAGGEQRR